MLLQSKSEASCNKVETLENILLLLVGVAILGGAKFSILSVVVLGILIGLVVFAQEEFVLKLLVFLMPLATIFKTSPNSTSFFTILIIIYVFLNLIKQHTISVDVLILLGYLSIITLFGGNNALLDYVKFMTNLLFVCIVEKKISSKIVMSYVIGIVFSSSIAFFFQDYFQLSKFIVYKHEGLDIIRFSGLSTDPNYYSVNIIIALTLLIILYGLNQIRISVLVPLSVALVCFSIITYSKSAVLMMAIPFLLFLYVAGERRKFIIQVLAICLIISGFIYLIGNKSELVLPIMRRLEKITDFNSLTTGRSRIWSLYTKELIDHPISVVLGRGIGAALPENRAAHNTYLEIIYHFGVIGGFILIRILRRLLKEYNTLENQKKDFVNYSVIVSVAIMYFFLSELFSYDAPFHICFAIWVYKLSEKSIRLVRSGSLQGE